MTTKSGKKPKLHLVGTVGKSLVVAAGLTADPKQKGRFIGVVVLINRKTSSTMKARNVATAARGATPPLFVYVGDDLPGRGPFVESSLRKAICRANTGDKIIVGSTFLANPPGVGITPFMDASFAASCDQTFGSYNGAAAGNAFLNGFGNTIGTPNPFSCTLRTQPDPAYSTTEWNIFANCNQAFTGAVFTFPAGTSISAFLPASGSASGNMLTFNGLNIAGGTQTEFDVRFITAFAPGEPFSAVLTGSGGTASVNSNGPQ